MLESCNSYSLVVITLSCYRDASARLALDVSSLEKKDLISSFKRKESKERQTNEKERKSVSVGERGMQTKEAQSFCRGAQKE